jgi:peroxiredoxin
MPMAPGERAPEFSVPAVHEDRTIALADYRGRTPLLLGLFPGLYCPFCRRALTQMAGAGEALKPLGVDCLAIVGTELENARLYFQYRPTRLRIAVDPQLETHRSFGVPRPEPTPDLIRAVEAVKIDPYGELPEPLPVMLAGQELNRRDGREAASTFTQMKGQFLIDRDGVIRWANIECGKEGLSGLGKFPTPAELLAAARSVSATLGV